MGHYSAYAVLANYDPQTVLLAAGRSILKLSQLLAAATRRTN